MLSLSCCSYTSVFTSVCKADHDGSGVILVRLTLALTLLVAISAQIGGLMPLFLSFIEAGYGYNLAYLRKMLAAAFSFKVLCDMFETIDIISWMIAARKLEDPEDLEGGEQKVLLECEGKFFGIALLMIPKMTMECVLGMFGNHCILLAPDHPTAFVTCLYVILLSELDELIYNSMAPQGVLKKVKPVTIETHFGRTVYLLIPPICKVLLSLVLYLIFSRHFTTLGIVKGVMVEGHY